MSKKTFMSEFASPLINEAESRFGVSLNPRLRSKLGIKGKTTSSIAPTGAGAGVGKGVKKAAEMAKMAGAAKMILLSTRTIKEPLCKKNEEQAGIQLEKKWLPLVRSGRAMEKMSLTRMETQETTAFQT